MRARDAEATARVATSLWGSASVRVAGDADTIDGCAPLVVLEPHDAATLAGMLQWADAERLAVVPRGGGTKLTWGSIPSRADVVLSTVRLSAAIDHCAGDLTATVSAGASLAQVNEVLGRERQWLSLDPPSAHRATIGGILATNDAGPRRHKYGAPRDLVIGIEMALVDGRTAKAGGRVVKNVAGYDLGRLLCGSFGTLAVITSATFKLAPGTPASRTVVATVSDTQRMTELALALIAAPLTPSAVECEWPAGRMLIRFETTETAAAQQAAAACELCHGRAVATSVVQDSAEADVWQEYQVGIWNGDGTLVKIAVLPTALGNVLDRIERAATNRSVVYWVGGRAALGVLFLRLSGDSERHGEIVRDLRADVEARGGSVVIVSSSAAFRARVDPWGQVGDGHRVMCAVKACFDPHGTLNPGRGPGGL